MANASTTPKSMRNKCKFQLETMHVIGCDDNKLNVFTIVKRTFEQNLDESNETLESNGTKNKDDIRFYG